MPVMDTSVLVLLAGPPDFDQIASGGYDIGIVESGMHSTATGPLYTAAQLDTLGASGTAMLAYLNLSVTDHNRDYWNADFTTGATPGNSDMDPLTGVAGTPSWLTDDFGFANDFGRIVDYRDPTWLNDVLLPYAKDMISSGYHGLFLDDALRYFQAGSIADDGYEGWEAARDMMQLVVDLYAGLDADPTINASELTIYVNNGVYLINDYYFGNTWTVEAPADIALIDQYRAIVDGLVVENASESNPEFWTAANYWYNGIIPGLTTVSASANLVAIETAAVVQDFEDLFAVLEAEDIDLFFAATDAYDLAPPPPIVGTSNAETLSGGAGADLIFGRGGADQITGADGTDILLGMEGDDILDGGVGADILTGGAGADIFAFSTNKDRDTITDFAHSEDKIDLSALVEGIDFIQFMRSGGKKDGSDQRIASSGNFGHSGSATVIITAGQDGSDTVLVISANQGQVGNAITLDVTLTLEGVAVTELSLDSFLW